jgi:hypothetical protein
MRVGIAVFLAVCVMMSAGSAWAETVKIGDDLYSKEDLDVIKAIKPELLPNFNLDAPTIEEMDDLSEIAWQFPPSISIGETAKIWIEDGAANDEDYSGSSLGWFKSGGGDTWRLGYLGIYGTDLTTFDFKKLTPLENLYSLDMENASQTTMTILPDLPNLSALAIKGDVESVDISKLVKLISLQVEDTGVKALSLPASPEFEYLLCQGNSDLAELSGFYGKEAKVKPFPGDGNPSIFGNPQLKEYSVTITSPENGTITKNGGDKIYNGDSVTFTIKGDSGYKLGTLTINGSPVTLTGNTYTHKATGNVTVAATFVEDSGTDPTKPDDPPSADDTEPPSADDNTTVIVGDGHDDKIVKISVTKSGDPIPAGVLFKVWLLRQSNQRQNVSSKAASDPSIGPFVVTSMEGSLNIDVDNLKNPDGTKAFIAAGSYIVKFADADEQYVGTTESINLEATEVTPPAGNNGGGCNTGYGLFGLLLAGILTFKCRKA